MKDYPYGYWLEHNHQVEIVDAKNTSPTVSGGMSCAGRFCGEYNNYAVPNQADGKTFLCHSCRSKPACLR